MGNLHQTVMPLPEDDALIWHVLEDIEGMQRYMAWKDGTWWWPTAAPMTGTPMTPEDLGRMGYDYVRPADWEFQRS